MERLGIVDDLQASTAALIESARRRGMSESALARLPRPAQAKLKPLPPVVLPPVCEANPGAQARMLAFRSLTKRERKARPRNNRSFSPTAGRSDITTADRALYAQIVAIAGAAGGVSADEIHDFIRPRKVVPVRHICWLLMREFSGLGTPAIARIAKRLSSTSISEGIARTIRSHINSPRWAAVYWETRTRLAASGSVIVEDIVERRGGRS